MGLIERTTLLGYTSRDLDKRRKMATKERFVSQSDDHKSFGYDYFDNPSGIGYGGYYYDGRYATEVKKIIDFFNLKPPAKILEIGCAKGFILTEFYKLGFDITGIDASDYCVNNCHESVAGMIKYGKAVDFEFSENGFDLVVCKEMIPHLDRDEAKETVQLMNNWAEKSLLVIQCVSDPKYAKKFKYWDSTHKLAMTEDEWVLFLEDCGYEGLCNFKSIL